MEKDSGGVAAGFGHFTHIEMEAAIFLLYSDRGRNEIITFPSHKKHRHNCAITVLQRINKERKDKAQRQTTPLLILSSTVICLVEIFPGDFLIFFQ